MDRLSAYDNERSRGAVLPKSAVRMQRQRLDGTVVNLSVVRNGMARLVALTLKGLLP